VIATYLRARALLDVAIGILLLAATWDGLYDALDLPLPRPELYAQIAGAALLGFAYLLWIAPRSEAVTQAVTLAAAIGNALSAVILLVWLVRGDVDGLLLWLFLPVCAVSAAIEAAIASRRVALLVPGD
jgi:hypothetical protein